MLDSESYHGLDYYLRQGGDIYSGKANGTMMHRAAYLNRPAFAAALVAFGFDIAELDSMDQQSRTRLMELAVDNGSLSMVKLFHSLGMSVTEPGRDGLVPVAQVVRRCSYPQILV